MAAGTLSTKDSPLWSLLKGALYLVVLAAVVHTLHNKLRNPFSATLISAVVVSLAASRARQPDPQRPTTKQLFRAVLIGPGLGAALLLVALAAGASPTWSLPGVALVFAVVEATAGAYRNELWLRGLPLLFARRARIDDRITAPYLVLVALAAAALTPGRTLPGMILVATSGAFFTLLWLRAPSSWLVIACHASWLLVSDGLLAGELVGLGRVAGHVASGATASGVLAWTAAAGFALMAALVWRNLPARPDDNGDTLSGQDTGAG